MTITVADARHVAEPNRRPGRLTFSKSAEASGQMLALDEAEGVVTAIVSVTGTEDEVADIIVPGAYRETLMKRRPKVCWAHSWEAPIGRVLHIEEIMPGDERLPEQTKDGQPWPREAGALVATMQFNMKSERGREAFEATRFYSETGECEWSIGYQVPAGKSTRDKMGVRHIKMLELYELSVVLFGAHTMTGTIDIKTAVRVARKVGRGAGAEALRKALALQGKAPVPPQFAKGDDEGDKPPADKPEKPAEGGAVKPATGEQADDGESDGPPDFRTGVMVAVYPDETAAAAVAKHTHGVADATPQDDLHVTLAYLGSVDEVSMSAADIAAAVQEAAEEAGVTALSGQIAGIGAFPDSGDGVPTWAPVDVPGLSGLREAIVNRLGSQVRQDHGFTPHMTLGYNIDLAKPVEETPVTFDTVKIVYGTAVTDVPLGGGAPPAPEPGQEGAEGAPAAPAAPPAGDESGAGLFGAEGAEDEQIKTLRQFIYRGMMANLGIKAEGGADQNAGGAEQLRHYWVSGEGAAKIRWGTPGDFTRCVRLVGKHMDPERAKGYCANRHKDATGMWPGDRDNKSTGYDPALDIDVTTETKWADPVPAGKAYPYLSGSYEERLDAVRAAVSEALYGEFIDDEEQRREWDHVSIDATWDDRVIASRMKWRGGDDERETYEMPYHFGPEGVEIGEMQRLTLTVVAIAEDGSEDTDIPLADTMPLVEDIDRVSWALKGATASVREAKAGRVLSAANETRIRESVEHLVSVLGAAGLRLRLVDTTDPDTPDDTVAESQRTADYGTTAPSAQVGKSLQGGEMIALDPDQIARDLADLGIDIEG